MSSPPQPPVAHRHVEERHLHGVVVKDAYGWLRQREDPRVLEYLELENRYTESMTAAGEPLRHTLYRELADRVPAEDESVPVRRADFLYGNRLAEGAQYAVHWRRPGGADREAAEEVVLDLEAMSADHEYLALGALRISPDQRLAAYLLDFDGSERFQLRIRDLDSGQDLPDRVDDVASACEWSSDSRTVFYVTRDAAHRPYRLLCHQLGDDASRDRLLYEETDERFFLALGKTRSQRFLVMTLGTHSTSEVHVLDADRPETGLRCIARRQPNIDWQLDHWHDRDRQDDRFYLLTNLGAPNFTLLSAPVADPGSRRQVVAERRDVVLAGVDCFQGHLVLSIRRDGLSGLEIRHLESGDSHQVSFEEAVGTVSPVDNETFDTAWLRFAFQSPLTPSSIFDYHMDRRERKLLKRAEVKGHRPESYVCRRLLVAGLDGVEIPVSLIEACDRAAGGPLLLYGYGSYGTPLEPRFSSPRLSLLDRGFAVALAHVRGGGEYGRGWYEAAKLGTKAKTFDDVIAVAEHLVEAGVTTSRGMMLQGGSAGGLMVGAVLNRRPDLFQGAIADVPFVDVLHTMLDPSIPLTVIEFEEWGDPATDPRAFTWIHGYSPYENVRATDYPHLLVTAGLHDPRVQYWEPAKWVARLRRRKTDDNLLLLRVEMGSGHRGVSGRYNSLHQEAFKLAFLLEAQSRERKDAATPDRSR